MHQDDTLQNESMCTSIIKDQRARLQLLWNSERFSASCGFRGQSLLYDFLDTRELPHHSSICISCRRQECLSFSSESHCGNSNNCLNSTEMSSHLLSYMCPMLSSEKLDHQYPGKFLLHHSMNHFIPCIIKKVPAMCTKGAHPAGKPWQQEVFKKGICYFLCSISLR